MTMRSRGGRWVAGLAALTLAAVAFPFASAAPSLPDGLRAEMQQMLEAALC